MTFIGSLIRGVFMLIFFFAVLLASILVYWFLLIKTMPQYLKKLKYKILCFILFISLVANISLYHENTIHKKGILQAMRMLGLGGLDDDSLPVKSQLGLINEYLEELWFKDFLLRGQNED